MPCGTTIQWQPRIFDIGALGVGGEHALRPAFEAVELAGDQRLERELVVLELRDLSLRPCLAAKSRVDTISKMPASALALIRP